MGKGIERYFSWVASGEYRQLYEALSQIDLKEIASWRRAIRYDNHFENLSLLEYVCLNPEAELLRLLLLHDWPQHTLIHALQLLLQHGHDEFVTDFIACGVEPNQALRLACKYQRHVIIQNLLASFNCDVTNAKPVNAAAIAGDVQALAMLKQAGFNLRGDNDNPIKLAGKNRQVGTVAYLLEQGVPIDVSEHYLLKVAIINNDKALLDLLLNHDLPAIDLQKNELNALVDTYADNAIKAAFYSYILKYKWQPAINTAESMHVQSVEQSIQGSLKRLLTQYSIEPAVLEKVLPEIISFVEQHQLSGYVDKLLKTQFEYEAGNQKLSFSELLALCWQAIHDSGACYGALEDGKAAFLAGLRDSDQSPCLRGAFQKPIEALAGFHQAVQIEFRTLTTASYKLQAVVRNQYQRFFAATTPDPSLDKAWPTIRPKVKAAMLDEFADLFQANHMQAEDIDAFIEAGHDLSLSKV